MLNKKEKNVKNYFLDENIEFSNEDKDIVLNKIKSKINLEVEEKPSFKQKFNLKVVYALVCSLVICVVGFIGIRFFNNNFIDPNYRGKNVESLNLDEGDYCLAYNTSLSGEEILCLKNKYGFDLNDKKTQNSYIINNNGNLELLIKTNDGDLILEIYLTLSHNEIYILYNSTYNTSFNESNLNDRNSGLLFGVLENGIEFYTIKNGLSYSIFVEFA